MSNAACDLHTPDCATAAAAVVAAVGGAALMEHLVKGLHIRPMVAHDSHTCAV